MARLWTMHTAVQAHSPMSRQLVPISSSFVESVLARRSLSAISSSSRPSSSASSSASPSGSRRNQKEQFGHFSLGAAGAFFSCQHRFGQLSASGIVLLSGMERAQISTVASRAASEAGVGSDVKNKDREILVQHLLVKEDDVQLLSELQRQIVQEGQDLSDLAGEHSLCPSKAEGGMIGWVKPGQTDPAFEEAAFNAPLNRVVRVKTKHGWHLVQVLNERKAHFLEQLQVERLHERMQDPTFLEESQLIDVREPHEISTAAIKGFKAYPLSEFGKWAPDIADDLDPEKDTYVLCHHGMRSMQAATWLQSQMIFDAELLYHLSVDYALDIAREIPVQSYLENNPAGYLQKMLAQEVQSASFQVSK